MTRVTFPNTDNIVQHKWTFRCGINTYKVNAKPQICSAWHKSTQMENSHIGQSSELLYNCCFVQNKHNQWSSTSKWSKVKFASFFWTRYPFNQPMISIPLGPTWPIGHQNGQKWLLYSPWSRLCTFHLLDIKHFLVLFDWNTCCIYYFKCTMMHSKTKANSLYVKTCLSIDLHLILIQKCKIHVLWEH